MRILVRADGDAEIGTGHVMRMLALAEHAVTQGAAVALASARLSPALAARARALGVDVIENRALAPGSAADLAWLLALAMREREAWVCVDGYAFDAGYQSDLARRVRCLWVDDFGRCTRYDAALVLNHQVYADASAYAARGEQTRLLLGTRYVPLRREFCDTEPPPPAAAPTAERILVTMGGADPVNATALVAEALTLLSDPALEARVLVGPSNPRGEEIERRFAGPRLWVLRGTDDMVGLLRWAELAVAAAGTTTHELCYMGVPSMLVVLADNQREVCAASGRHGVAEALGWYHAFDPASLARRIESLRRDAPARLEMSKRGRALVDGRGASRILEAMRSVATGEADGARS